LIVFLTALGRGIGLGNASRVRSVALALSELGTGALVVIAGPDDLVGALDWSGLQVKVLPQLPDALAMTADLGREYPGSMLITDLPGLTHAHAVEFRAAGFAPLVHLCIPGSDSYDCDLLVTGFPGTLPLQPVAGRVSSGPEYLVVRPEVVRARPTMLLPDRPITSVLVAMGGSDPGGNSLRMVDWFEPTGVDIAVLVGPGIPVDNVDKFRERWATVIRAQAPHEVVAALRGHDLVVTQGGLMSVEAMCLGTAVACIGWQGLEAFVDALAEAGLISLLDPDLPADERLDWLAEQPRSTRRSKAFAMIDGAGARRIAELVIALDAGRRR